MGKAESSPKLCLSVPYKQGGSFPISTYMSDFGIRPPPMLLSVEFSGGVLPARSESMKKARLADLHKKYIVLGKAWKLSNVYIASVLDCHPDTVANFLKKLRHEEGIIYDIGVVQRIGTGRGGKAIRYFCRVCGATYLELRPAADHAFYHVFPDGGGLLVPLNLRKDL